MPELPTFTPFRQQKGQERLKDALELTGGDLPMAEGLMRAAIDSWSAAGGVCLTGREWEEEIFRDTEQFHGWIFTGTIN